PGVKGAKLARYDLAGNPASAAGFGRGHGEDSQHDCPDTCSESGKPGRAHMMRMNTLNTELHMRPALSFGCLFFVLIGCPVGIWFSRSDSLSAFISCYMLIVFIYYLIQLCCTNFSKDGKIHPFIALWAANMALGIMALFLYRKLVRN